MKPNSLHQGVRTAEQGGKQMRILLTLLVTVCLALNLTAGIKTGAMFEQYFENRTMRVDYYHMADKTNEYFSIDHVFAQGPWAGNPDSLIDPFNNGKYYVKIFDKASGQLIYSRGFNSYCGEYMTTDMAADGIKRTYLETALIPFPKAKIIFALERRDKMNQLQPYFKQEIDPAAVSIIKFKPDKRVTVLNIQNKGPAHKKVDLAFIAEGYTSGEKIKFKKDLERVTQLFFSYEPYKSQKDSFNIYGVFKPSQDKGTDEPTHGVYKNTVAGSTFNALGLYRYNLTESNRAIHDLAAHVPYDSVVILVNSERYGGGGIYNAFCLFTMELNKFGFLFLHEFGHSFGGLADEYYSSKVAYNEFFPPGVEPVEPNITALLDPDNLKWRQLVTKGVKIPTPWDKEKFDKKNHLGKKIHLANPKYRGKTGAFEGAGYASTGLYRPAIDCLMHTSTLQPYCSVCQEAIASVIRYHTR